MTNPLPASDPLLRAQPFDAARQQRRLLWLLAAILGVAFAATAALAYWVASTEVRANIIERELPLTGDSIYSEIQRDILRPVFVSAQMAENTFLREWVQNGERNDGQILRYLREVQKKNNAVTSFFVSEKTRRYYHPGGEKAPVKADEASDAWYFKVAKIAAEYEINADLDMRNQSLLTLFINYKMRDDQGNYLGITGVGLSSENMVKLITGYENKFNRRISLINERGEVMLSSRGVKGDFEKGSATALKNIKDGTGMNAVVPAILQGGATPLRLTYRSAAGEPTFVNSRFVPELRWFLIIEQEEKAALAPVRRVLLLTSIIGILATLFTIAVVRSVVVRFQTQLKDMASVDELSQLANRRAGQAALENAVRQAHAQRQPLGLLVADIDHFKRVNDELGHPAGDALITAIARIAKRCVRSSDVVVRWGGEEFVLILHGASPQDCLQIAEQLRAQIAANPFELAGQRISKTISIGAAQLTPQDTASSLFARADSALLRAKAGGRDRVEVG